MDERQGSQHDVAGLLAAQIEAFLPHALDHVPVANRRALDATPFSQAAIAPIGPPFAAVARPSALVDGLRPAGQPAQFLRRIALSQSDR
jgi:hypothetical protein